MRGDGDATPPVDDVRPDRVRRQLDAGQQRTQVARRERGREQRGVGLHDDDAAWPDGGERLDVVAEAEAQHDGRVGAGLDQVALSRSPARRLAHRVVAAVEEDTADRERRHARRRSDDGARERCCRGHARMRRRPSRKLKTGTSGTPAARASAAGPTGSGMGCPKSVAVTHRPRSPRRSSASAQHVILGPTAVRRGEVEARAHRHVSRSSAIMPRIARADRARAARRRVSIVAAGCRPRPSSRNDRRASGGEPSRIVREHPVGATCARQALLGSQLRQRATRAREHLRRAMALAVSARATRAGRAPAISARVRSSPR
jgi:hypothetical protein